jgi:hypothetical protein
LVKRKFCWMLLQRNSSRGWELLSKREAGPPWEGPGNWQ